MIALALLLGLLPAADEDATSATLAFERMHCDECKAELEASVKRMPGFKSVAIAGNSAVVTFEEKAAVPAFNRLPKDLSLRSVTLSIRGTAGASGEKATFVARNGTAYTLVNADKSSDPVGDLRKKLGGKNRFRITGTLAGGNAIRLAAFQPADWKD